MERKIKCNYFLIININKLETKLYNNNKIVVLYKQYAENVLKMNVRQVLMGSTSLNCFHMRGFKIIIIKLYIINITF